MAVPVSAKCAQHIPYGSEMLATNAATLHGFGLPDCQGVTVFPCGDHFHIGHDKPSHSRHCKEASADDEERKAVERGWNRGKWSKQARQTRRDS
jgi:hypothetical protein